MAAVRSLLARVARLEQAGKPVASPFERGYGSLDAFEATAQGSMDAGALDRRDGCVLLRAIRQWHADRVWDVSR